MSQLHLSLPWFILFFKALAGQKLPYLPKLVKEQFMGSPAHCEISLVQRIIKCNILCSRTTLLWTKWAYMSHSKIFGHFVNKMHFVSCWVQRWFLLFTKFIFSDYKMHQSITAFCHGILHRMSCNPFSPHISQVTLDAPYSYAHSFTVLLSL